MSVCRDFQLQAAVTYLRIEENHTNSDGMNTKNVRMTNTSRFDSLCQMILNVLTPPDTSCQDSESRCDTNRPGANQRAESNLTLPAAATTKQQLTQQLHQRIDGSNEAING